MWQLLEQTPNPRGTYPEKKETHHSLVKEERERWGKIKPPRSILEIHGPSREDLRSEPSLRIYSLLEDEPRLRYRKNIAIEELWLSCFAYYTVLPEGGMLQERR